MKIAALLTLISRCVTIRTIKRMMPTLARVTMLASFVLLQTTGVLGRLIARPNKCQDIPLRVTLYNNAVTDPVSGSTVPSAITSDGAGEYLNLASIQMCSGTHDAVLNVSSSKRTFTYALPAPIPGSVIQAVPSWVPGTYSGSGWINIRNITFSKQPFATQAGSTFSLSVDRSSYRLGFKGLSPDLPNAPNLDDPGRTASDNTPLPSSPVIVYPTYPSICGPGSMPTWLVRATSANSPGAILEVGTLHKEANGMASETHEGQYSLPFEMLIEATQCFTY